PSSNTVTVQWETIVVPELDSALQAEPGADYVADSGEVTFVPDDVDEMVSIDVAGDAIGENDELILVRFHSPTNAEVGGFYGLGVVVIVDDDERVLTVTPNTDLDGGDLVTLAGSGWAPGSTVAACQADAQPTEPAVNACLSGQFGAVTTTVAPDGTISVPYRVRRQGFVAARGEFIDCTDGATPCVIGAGEIVGATPVGQIATVPLAFAVPPTPPATRGQITVTPSVDVIDGETLTVTGTGFRPGAAIEIYLCLAPVTGPSNCDWTTRVDVDADGAGDFATTMPADQFLFGSNNCATRPCDVTAAEAVDFVGTFTTTPIAFAPAPP
ncbi:MAG: neocarzinostatin apoprotein domain-containing protein, partial [Acidimicrobiales bacterium]